MYSYGFLCKLAHLTWVLTFDVEVDLPVEDHPSPLLDPLANERLTVVPRHIPDDETVGYHFELFGI